ncbi:HAMP domain-containing protein [Deinococcus taeanensis]|uniref:sensor histidine kinase n=1 Tax=Deinococcus taeanensis TaxID=2737050 RepID=UPI001CDD5FD9|nr:ATP-binding protein [Deinococcus taeanensis]UBV41857.1 HAMP domain-containing protein [Deinococcus taeanensis]
MTGPRRTQPLAVTLLLAMLLVVLVAVGSTFYFSNLVVKREFERLPSTVRLAIREQQAAALRGELVAPTPPLPVVRTGTPADPYLDPFDSSPDVGGVVRQATGQDAVVTAGKRPRELRTDPGRQPPRNRAQDFLRDVQSSLLQVGLVAAAVSALLAFLISRRVARPVSAVSRAAARLASGDLSTRAPVRGGEREIAALAQSFNDMAENLQLLERERQQAVADIAHELRTPIAVMQARLDALEDGVYPLTTGQIALLSTQTQLLTRLVGDLRTLTLADAGRLALDPQPLDLGALGAEVVRDLQDRADARGLNLTLQAVPALTRADPVRVRQITTNLIDNALRHARSRVAVRVEVHGPQVLLHVEDDGPGIPQESRDAVFTRFTRLDASRARDTGGSGLGLAIVRALALAHGGQAALSTSSGLGGAHFTVTLPTAAP